MSCLRTLWRANGTSWKRREPVLERFKTLLTRLGCAAKRLGSVSNEYEAVFQHLKTILRCLGAPLRRLGRVLNRFGTVFELVKTMVLLHTSIKNHGYQSYNISQPRVGAVFTRPGAVVSRLGTHWRALDTSWRRLEAVSERFRIILTRLGTP